MTHITFHATMNVKTIIWGKNAHPHRTNQNLSLICWVPRTSLFYSALVNTVCCKNFDAITHFMWWNNILEHFGRITMRFLHVNPAHSLFKCQSCHVNITATFSANIDMEEIRNVFKIFLTLCNFWYYMQGDCDWPNYSFYDKLLPVKRYNLPFSALTL
jgi:hypothetical protein